MLPEATSVPLAVLPALALEAAPGSAPAKSLLPSVGFELLDMSAVGGGVVVDGACGSVGDVDVAGVWLLTGGVVCAGLVVLPTAPLVLSFPVVDG